MSDHTTITHATTSATSNIMSLFIHNDHASWDPLILTKLAGFLTIDDLFKLLLLNKIFCQLFSHVLKLYRDRLFSLELGVQCNLQFDELSESVVRLKVDYIPSKGLQHMSYVYPTDYVNSLTFRNNQYVYIYNFSVEQFQMIYDVEQNTITIRGATKDPGAYMNGLIPFGETELYSKYSKYIVSYQFSFLKLKECFKGQLAKLFIKHIFSESDRSKTAKYVENMIESGTYYKCEPTINPENPDEDVQAFTIVDKIQYILNEDGRLVNKANPSTKGINSMLNLYCYGQIYDFLKRNYVLSTNIKYGQYPRGYQLCK